MLDTPITIVGGTGDAGFGLALRWAVAGYEVIIGSRDGDRARNAANEAVAVAGVQRVRGLQNQAAVAESTMIVLSVPFAAQAATLKDIGDHLRAGTILVDITVPLGVAIGGRVTQTVGVWEGSAAERSQALLGDRAQVVAAFQNVAADTLRDLALPVDEDVIVCGPRAAKERMRELVECLPGARYVDGGGLDMARHVEGITALLAGINGRYKVRGAGVRITGLPG